MKPRANIVLAGVGGQGIILASRILSEAALEEGFDVKKSEVHGMSQRGGSVVSFLRVGEDLQSPLIAHGTADLLLAFEPLEAVRYLHFVKDGGVVVSNDRPIPVGDYPTVDELIETLGKRAETVVVDALELATQAGNPLTQNVALVGVAASHLPFADDTLLSVIRRLVPEKAKDVNEKAFHLGKDHR